MVLMSNTNKTFLDSPRLVLIPTLLVKQSGLKMYLD
jgi:hypothetical protein